MGIRSSSRLTARISKIFERLAYHTGWIAGGLTLIMMIAIMREVVGRHFFRNPSQWTIELTAYLLVGLVYLAAPYTESVGRHIRIDFVYLHFKGRVKNVADIVSAAAGASWAAILVWQGWKLAWNSAIIGATSAEAMRWPLFPSQVIVPIGSLALFLVLVARMCKSINSLVRGRD